jgi:hypothetical protein
MREHESLEGHHRQYGVYDIVGEQWVVSGSDVEVTIAVYNGSICYKSIWDGVSVYYNKRGLVLRKRDAPDLFNRVESMKSPAFEI